MSLDDVTQLAAKAVRCRACFEDGIASPALIDIAQPRWIGPAYWESSPRVLAVMLNPGSGDFRTDSADHDLKRHLAAFSKGAASLAPIFEHQRIDMRNWGRGRFASFFFQALKLDVERTAFANIAWCADAANRYPTRMLRTCFDRFTNHLIRNLAPEIVLLSGGATHRFEVEIRQIVPTAVVLKTLHYAHREGAEAQRIALQPILEGLQSHGALTARPFPSDEDQNP